MRLIASLFLAIIVFAGYPTTNTKAADTQDATATKQMLVNGSPWINPGKSKGQGKYFSLMFFLGKDGKFTATFNDHPALYLKVDGKKVTLKAKKDRGKEFEFSLALDSDGKLSGSVEYERKSGKIKESLVRLETLPK